MKGPVDLRVRGVGRGGAVIPVPGTKFDRPGFRYEGKFQFHVGTLAARVAAPNSTVEDDIEIFESDENAEERYVDFTDRYRRRESQGLVVVID